ncbi:hypothetical protein J2T13_001890 [Paenibacillus sp. DS2015]
MWKLVVILVIGIFPESGDVIYKDYFIDSDLTPLLVK